MAMNGDTLGAAIWTKIKTRTGVTYTPEQDALGLAFWKDIAGEIVNHVKNQAAVTVTGVTTGGGTAPGTVS